MHVVQIRRYETNTSQPRIEAIKKLATALAVSTDTLLFDEGERGPDDELRLQFEALKHFSPEEKQVAKAVLESLILIIVAIRDSPIPAQLSAGQVAVAQGLTAGGFAQQLVAVGGIGIACGNNIIALGGLLLRAVTQGIVAIAHTECIRLLGGESAHGIVVVTIIHPGLRIDQARQVVRRVIAVLAGQSELPALLLLTYMWFRTRRIHLTVPLHRII